MSIDTPSELIQPDGSVVNAVKAADYTIAISTLNSLTFSSNSIVAKIYTVNIELTKAIYKNNYAQTITKKYKKEF